MTGALHLFIGMTKNLVHLPFQDHKRKLAARKPFSAIHTVKPRITTAMIPIRIASALCQLQRKQGRRNMWTFNHMERKHTLLLIRMIIIDNLNSHTCVSM